jgi:hypothetical protein
VTVSENRTLPANPQNQQFRESIERYLEGVSSYAESVAEDIAWSDDEGEEKYQTPLTSANGNRTPSSHGLAAPVSSKAFIPSSSVRAEYKHRLVWGGISVAQGHCGAWVPNSTLCVFTAPGKLWFLDASTGYWKGCLPIEDYTITTTSKPPIFSPDGSLMAVPIDSGDAIYVNSVPDFNSPLIIETAIGADYTAFSPNNRRLAIANSKGDVEFFERRRGESQFAKKYLLSIWNNLPVSPEWQHTKTPRDSVHGVAFTPDSKEIVFATHCTIDGFLFMSRELWKIKFDHLGIHTGEVLGNIANGDGMRLLYWGSELVVAYKVDRRVEVRRPIKGLNRTLPLIASLELSFGLAPTATEPGDFINSCWTVGRAAGKTLACLAWHHLNGSAISFRNTGTVNPLAEDKTRLVTKDHLIAPALSSDLKRGLVRLKGTDLWHVWDINSAIN